MYNLIAQPSLLIGLPMSSPVTVLFSDRPANWLRWRDPLEAAFARRGLEVTLTDQAEAGEVDYIVYSPEGGLVDFTPFTALKAVFSMWAGVEKMVGNPSLNAPLTRMIDTGLAEGMRDYVLAHVMRYHTGLDAHIGARRWTAAAMPPLASERVVGIAGFGALGQQVGAALHQLGFQVIGWRNRPDRVDYAQVVSGADGLETLLLRSDILVLLLPQTPATTDLFDARRFAQMRPGACLINAGRGTAIVDADLIDALDHGPLAGATLDVFRQEPLPETHPFWHHPKVTVTPHIAAATRPETAAEVIADNLDRALRGAPLRFEVNPEAGY